MWALWVDQLHNSKVVTRWKQERLWWVFLIVVWLCPSWLPAPLASPVSARWLLCPRLTHQQTHTHSKVCGLCALAYGQVMFLFKLAQVCTSFTDSCIVLGSNYFLCLTVFTCDFSSRAPRLLFQSYLWGLHPLIPALFELNCGQRKIRTLFGYSRTIHTLTFMLDQCFGRQNKSWKKILQRKNLLSVSLIS